MSKSLQLDGVKMGNVPKKKRVNTQKQTFAGLTCDRNQAPTNSGGEKPNGLRQANLVLIAYASSEGSGKPAHPRSLPRTFAARSYKQ